MFTFALIGLAFALIGVAGLQIMYLLYLDRVMRDRKTLIKTLERQNKRLRKQLEQARIRNQIRADQPDDEWAEVID
ncbi:MAG: hypothetical protein JNL64_05440 [Blastocatellia bacterium]|jgi:hypothetical protein|nr:hypothetical protein [Blastocatellia bacterium]